MNLADHQRALLGLIISEPEVAADAAAVAADDYVATVAASMQLEVVRDIGDSWRRFTLRRMCPLTWRLLEQRNHLERACAGIGARLGVSPFLLVLARQFLDGLAAGDDPLDAAVARFERSLLDAPQAIGSAALPVARPDEVVIDWPCDPEEVLSRLVADEFIGWPQPGHFRTRASAGDPTAFVIEDLTLTQR